MRRKIDWTRLVMTFGLITLMLIWLLGKYQLVQAREANPFVESVKFRATCYCDNGITASGKQTRPGIIAAKSDWLGYVACVNAVNEDGSIGEFIGFYEILDTGYGAETGVGESSIKPGKTLGTIEAGQTIDFYMPTQHQAEEWIDTYGDHIFIKLIKGVG